MHDERPSNVVPARFCGFHAIFVGYMDPATFSNVFGKDQEDEWDGESWAIAY